ncbi:MAG: WYL domain-containing protein [Desulfobacter sp.]|nr:MAG: WYL domain-containing protein [Desulfobacter sp.]
MHASGETAIFRETKIHSHIKNGLAKLMHFVPEKTQNELAGLKQIFISKTIGSKTYAGHEKTIGKLTESILNRTSCQIKYHAFYKDTIENVEIGPLHFYENNGGLYLFALKMQTREIRTYAVERIKTIQRLKRNVNYPNHFDPQAVLNSAFNLTHGDPVRVKIRFSPNEAPYIKEKSWAADQQIQNHSDGSLTLSMTISGRRDVKRWVMSFGKEARVLEPEDLRMEIKDELKFMINT